MTRFFPFIKTVSTVCFIQYTSIWREKVSVEEKFNRGNYFEDLFVGREMIHATPRTITEGDQSFYIALTSSMYPLFCNAEFARSIGFNRELINDLLTFHIVFGNSVPDISLNAIANLGYGDMKFGRPVYPGDTITTTSTIIGQKESSTGDIGVTWVSTKGVNQQGQEVLSFVRWVLMNKKNPQNITSLNSVPEIIDTVPSTEFYIPEELDLSAFNTVYTGGKWFWEDYEIGERIHHVEGVAIEEAESQMAARLYQNTARAHFNAHALTNSRFGKRVIYGGHIISIAKSLSFNGFENVLKILAFNAGTHTNPSFAGDTIYAWTDIKDKFTLARDDVGALRLNLIAVKNLNPLEEEISVRVNRPDGKNAYHKNIVLDLDYTVLIPRKK